MHHHIYVNDLWPRRSHCPRLLFLFSARVRMRVCINVVSTVDKLSSRASAMVLCLFGVVLCEGISGSSPVKTIPLYCATFDTSCIMSIVWSPVQLFSWQERWEWHSRWSISIQSSFVECTVKSRSRLFLLKRDRQLTGSIWIWSSSVLLQYQHFCLTWCMRTSMVSEKQNT